MSRAVRHLGSGILAELAHRRTRAVLGTLLLVGLVVTLLGLRLGSYQVPWGAFLAALWGGGDDMGQLVLLNLRLPRALVALGAGAALATAGAIFQSLSRNPLASPDIIGLTTGSATGALVSILWLGDKALNLPMGALVGGLATVSVVYLFSLQRGMQGQRLVLIGLAVAAMLASVNDFLLTRAELDQALQAKMWLHGSLQGTGWLQAQRMALGCAVLLPLAWLLSPRLRLLEMGVDLATSLGLHVGRSSAYLTLVAVALTALAIACAGPIGFIALAAPQLARRLCRAPGIGLWSAALMGAVLCASADLLARLALAPFQIPVGLVTSALGGAYLTYLLAREWRSHDL
ncbi:MAG: iron chelate uptake ABC transporter family permease subunit [Rhodoferax sp.]|uniref:FecCD family ABC transporter permease n=2 Tax=Rhodoferax sp. TaxID=50421 RepID=UPI0032654C88